MPNLTQSDLNGLREIVSSHQTMACKFSDYANQCQDANLKQMFLKAAQDSRSSAQNLIQMI